MKTCVVSLVWSTELVLPVVEQCTAVSVSVFESVVMLQNSLGGCIANSVEV